jgi:hypothetical protein
MSGWVAFFSDDSADQGALLYEGLATAEAAHDPDTTARMHGVLGSYYLERADYSEARAHHAVELAGFRELGDQGNLGACLGNIGYTELCAGNLDAADAHFMAHEAIARDLNLTDQWVNVSLNRAIVAELRGDDALALDRAIKSFEIARRYGLKRYVVLALFQIARALPRTDPQLSATIEGAGSGILAAGGFILQKLDARLQVENEARLREALGDETYERHAARGRDLPVHDLIALARSSTPAATGGLD